MAGWVAGLLHFFGFDSDRLFSVIRLFAIVGVIFLCGVLLLQFAFDPNIYSSSFRHAPLYWFIVVIGAAVLVATYVLFGKKLLDQLKSLSA
jgi:drug/metabolite transporter (DMT)-like permease